MEPQQLLLGRSL